MPGFLLNLPDEVVLLILRDPSLGYPDLKRVSRVSKKLHWLERVRLLFAPRLTPPSFLTPRERFRFEQDGSLDLKTFRMGLPAFSSASWNVVFNEVDYHPIFDVANLLATEFKDVEVLLESRERLQSDSQGDDWVCPWQRLDVRRVKISDLTCLDEMATSPPCRELVWYMGDTPEAENDMGVTVKDAIVAAVEMWRSEVEEDSEHVTCLTTDLFDKVVAGQKMSWRYTQGDDCSWEGLNKAIMLEDPNTVMLFPYYYFGS